MAETIKIEFVELAALPLQTPVRPSSGDEGGRAGNARTLVVFTDKNFAFGEATLELIGHHGEMLIKKAAATVKFKGRR